MSKSDVQSAQSAGTVTPALKPGTKKARLAELLKPRKGVTIETLSSTLGWQVHSTRAAITGLRKAGFEIERLAGEDGTKAARYRLAGKAA